MPIDPLTGLYQANPGRRMMDPLTPDPESFGGRMTPLPGSIADLMGGSRLMQPSDMDDMDPDVPRHGLDPEVYASVFARQAKQDIARRGLDPSRFGDMLTDPLAGQRADVAGTEAANRAAVSRGFRGGAGLMPTQEEAGYQRAAAERQLEAPLRLEQAKQAGVMELERAKEAAAKETAATAQAQSQGEYQQFQDFIKANPNLINRLQVLSFPGQKGGMQFSPVSTSVIKPPVKVDPAIQKKIDEYYETLSPPAYSLKRMIYSPVQRQADAARIAGELSRDYPGWDSVPPTGQTTPPPGNLPGRVSPAGGATSRTVVLRSPDGSEREVSADQAQFFLTRGAQVVR